MCYINYQAYLLTCLPTKIWQNEYLQQKGCQTVSGLTIIIIITGQWIHIIRWLFAWLWFHRLSSRPSVVAPPLKCPCHWTPWRLVAWDPSHGQGSSASAPNPWLVTVDWHRGEHRSRRWAEGAWWGLTLPVSHPSVDFHWLDDHAPSNASRPAMIYHQWHCNGKWSRDNCGWAPNNFWLSKNYLLVSKYWSKNDTFGAKNPQIQVVTKYTQITDYLQRWVNHLSIWPTPRQQKKQQKYENIKITIGRNLNKIEKNQNQKSNG